MARMRVKADDSANEENEDEREPAETESGEEVSEESAEEEVRPARSARSGAAGGSGGTSSEETSEGEDENGDIREDIGWIKKTLGTIVAGSSERRPPRGDRTVVRVKESPRKEPPPPPPPPRGTKRLKFGGFGMRKARRSQ